MTLLEGTANSRNTYLIHTRWGWAASKKGKATTQVGLTQNPCPKGGARACFYKLFSL